MANIYWLSTAELYQPGFFRDYTNNPDKRLQTGKMSGLGENFWIQYGNAYKESRDNGGLILRAKVITDDILTLYQIYNSQQDHKIFKSKINSELFYSKIQSLWPGVTITKKESPLQEHEKNLLVSKILLADNVIIQALREDHRRSGIVIGDPLKKEALIYV